MNVWLGGQFYLWVRHYETTGASAYVSRPAGVEGWLPIAGMMNFKYFLLTGRVPELHSGGDVFAGDVRLNRIPVSEGILQLVMPGGNYFGVPREIGKEDLRAKFSIAAMGGYSAAWIEVCAARLLCVGGVEHVGKGNCRVHAESLWNRRRCEDAEFFPVHWFDRFDCGGLAGNGFPFRAEFLVPVFVSLWGAAGDLVDIQPVPHPAQRRDLH
jgi:hypothetical protein